MREAQLSAAIRALELLEADFERTLSPKPIAEIVPHDDGSLRVRVDGEFDNEDSGGIFALVADHVIVEVAETVQRILLEQRGPWPECRLHRRILVPDVGDTPIWQCRSGHQFGPIGALPE